MSHQTIHKHDVIIVGAGPVGLLLAYSALGFRLLNHHSTEVFYRRGLLSQVIATELLPGETTLAWSNEERKGKIGQRTPGDFPVAGHFAGIFIKSSNVDWSKWKNILPGPSALGGALKQGQLVKVLYQCAKELGVEVLFECPITHFEDTGTNVKVWTGLGSVSSNSTAMTENGSNVHFNDSKKVAEGNVRVANYLIGADGGRIFVRRQAGFTMECSEATWIGYMADCDLSARSTELLGPGFHRTNKGTYAARPPTTFVLDFDESMFGKDNSNHIQRPDVTREGFESALRRMVGLEELAVESLHLGGSFTDRAKVVTEFRCGRIFLAGDAAHIHSPLGVKG